MMADKEKGGKTSIGKSLHDLNVFLFEKNKKAMYIVAVILIPALTYFVFHWEAADKADEMLGKDEINSIISMFEGTGGLINDFTNTKNFDQMHGVIQSGKYLKEGSSTTIVVNASVEKVIEKLSVTVTWVDENNPPHIRVRRYQNQPDTFSANIIWPDGNITNLGENSDGTLSGLIILTDEQISTFYGAGDFKITVTCVNAGDWKAGVGIGILTMADEGNDFSITLEEDYLAPPAIVE